MPTIIARAVITTGLMRVRPASSAAAAASLPSPRCSLANVTIRMLLAIAAPIDMMAPIRLGTLKVVFQTKRALFGTGQDVFLADCHPVTLSPCPLVI
jgi:hypothetical protein